MYKHVFYFSSPSGLQLPCFCPHLKKIFKIPFKKQLIQLLTCPGLVLWENGNSTVMLSAADSKVPQGYNKACLSVLYRTWKINTQSVLDKGKQIFLF